ncbi:MAG: T9SS type A sorting domain-containing protein, partial [Bacteroidota bacterium]
SKAGFVEGNGTTNAPKEYSFTDSKLNAGKYSYRLKQIDRDGKFEYSQSVEVTIANVPKEFALEQNYPNPFNPSTMINYQLPMTNHVTLKVYDAIGREVATLVNEVKEAGSYTVQFDGTKLSSGIYFARLQSGEKSQVKKLMLMK